MNKSMFIGNVATQPTMRNTQSGKNYCLFVVAVNDRRKNGEETQYIRCTAWDKLGEICQQYLTTGTKVYVEGTAKAHGYLDKNAEAKAELQLTVQNMEMLSSKKKSDSQKLDETITDVQTGYSRQFTDEGRFTEVDVELPF